MADQPQQQAAQQGAASPRRRSFVAGLASAVASHAYLSLAVIVVLIILVIGLYVYYHGLFFLGPYARGASRRKGGSGSKKDGGVADEPADPETERLIETINRQ